MMKRGRFYLSRVIKRGVLDHDKLIQSIANAPKISSGKFDWTITDVTDSSQSEFQFIFGKLSKYSKEGHVTVVDEPSRAQVDRVAPNLLVASSPFVYLPNFSGIAFLHVWNGIQEDLFPRRLQDIVKEACQNFFVDIELEPISDYKAFTEKLKSLSKFSEISAKVYPPNPLFGRLWGSLNSYIKRRNASEISVKESNEAGDGVKTEIIGLMTKILEDPGYEPEKAPDITDAAILMAADGYGLGKVVGNDGESEVVIRTSDTQKSFLFEKDPTPEELAAEAKNHFESISRERNMEHAE